MTAAPLPFIVAATFFMEYLDTTIVATALPQMARSFTGLRTPSTAVGWLRGRTQLSLRSRGIEPNTVSMSS